MAASEDARVSAAENYAGRKVGDQSGPVWAENTARLHDLRHTAATLWLAAGASVYFVKEQLGHADLKTTIGTYGHADQAAHRKAAERAATWWRTGT